MRNQRTVHPKENLRAVATEARQNGCIVQVDPINHQAFIRPNLLPGLKAVNQVFYRGAV
jgi:hypothetical protein